MSLQKMEMSIRYILAAVVYVKCLFGFTVNLVIVAANVMKWKSQKSLQTCDKILSCLAISRALYFITIFLWNLFFLVYPFTAHIRFVIWFLYVQTMFMFFSTHWIAAILCVFYCVRIVTYNCKLLIFLKTRISTMVPWLILASLVISLISSLPLGWYGHDLKLWNLSVGSTENMTEYRLVVAQHFRERFIIFSVGSFPPFVIFCVGNFLLIHFLLMHTRRMRSNGSDVQSPNLESHFRALKSMSLFLLLQMMFVIAMSLFNSGRLFEFAFSILISRIILCGPPLVHSFYMISSSSEVKKMLFLMCLGIFRCS